MFIDHKPHGTNYTSNGGPAAERATLLIFVRNPTGPTLLRVVILNINRGGVTNRNASIVTVLFYRRNATVAVVFDCTRYVRRLRDNV